MFRPNSLPHLLTEIRVIEKSMEVSAVTLTATRPSHPIVEGDARLETN